MPTKPRITVTNIVANSRISGFDTDTIIKKIPGVRFRPNRFPATQIPMVGTMINLYDSGAVISTKATQETNAIQSIHDFVEKLNGIGMKCRVDVKPRISIINAIVEYHGNINVDALRKTREYVKDIPSFPAIQMSFPGGVAVKAYTTKLVISAGTIDAMMPAIKIIKKYVGGVTP